MKRILKNFGTMMVITMLVSATCPSSMAVKYTDGRFIRNTQVHECVKKIVKQHKEYKDEYGICCERIGFSFGVDKKTRKINDIEIIAPMPRGHAVDTFYIRFVPQKEISALELVNLFLNSNEFNEQDYTSAMDYSTVVSAWDPDNENEYDRRYSVMTDITEENWREKFSNEEDVIPDLCPGSLMFFELHPGEKFFVEGYEEGSDE